VSFLIGGGAATNGPSEKVEWMEVFTRAEAYAWLDERRKEIGPVRPGKPA
jgi:hypothetical protein